MSTMLRTGYGRGGGELGKEGETEISTYHGTNAVGGCGSKCVVVGVCSIKSSVTKKKAELTINKERKKGGRKERTEVKNGGDSQDEGNQPFPLHPITLERN